MPLVTSDSSYAAARELLRALDPPYLLRHYPATAEDYEEITDEDLKCEYVDGELIVHSPASLEHEDLNGFVLSLLREFVTSHSLGRVYGPNAVMQLGERRFSPDISVLLDCNAGRIAGKRVVGPMDLVVEVISESTRRYDHQTKVPAYREGCVAEIWLIDEQQRQFEVHAQHGDSYVSQVLPSGRWNSVILSGLTVDVDWFWQHPLPPISACRLGW